MSAPPLNRGASMSQRDAWLTASVAAIRSSRRCCLQAEVHEVAFRGIGAPLPERQVVLARPTFVAIPLDAKGLVRALPRQIEERLQRGSRFRAQLGAVEVEVDAGCDDLYLYGARSRRRFLCQGRSGRRGGR